MSVAAKIKQYIDENGISQTSLARDTGIALCKLNLALNENRELKLEEYRLICYALGVGVEKFLSPKPPQAS